MLTSKEMKEQQQERERIGLIDASIIPLIKDKTRLDFLDAVATEPVNIICRWSVEGKGWYLCEATKSEGFKTVREAIDAFMVANAEAIDAFIIANANDVGK